MKDKIKEIILQYCDGSYMKRFAYDDLDNMVNRIITTTEVKENDFIDRVSESFNEELRRKFFKECTHTRDDKGRTASLIRIIDLAPHDLFEWFKSNVR